MRKSEGLLNAQRAEPRGLPPTIMEQIRENPSVRPMAFYQRLVDACVADESAALTAVSKVVSAFNPSGWVVCR